MTSEAPGRVNIMMIPPQIDVGPGLTVTLVTSDGELGTTVQFRVAESKTRTQMIGGVLLDPAGDIDEQLRSALAPALKKWRAAATRRKNLLHAAR